MSIDLEKIMADAAVEVTEAWVPNPAHTPPANALAHLHAVEEAQVAALQAAGVTAADLKRKTVPAPKRPGRSINELERLRKKAENKAKWWTDEMTRLQDILDRLDGLQPRFEHGMLNLPLAGRQREANRGQRKHKELENANERRKHFERLEAKYANQIEKRKS